MASVLSSLASVLTLYYFARFLVRTIPGLGDALASFNVTLPSPLDALFVYYDAAVAYVAQWISFDGFISFLGYATLISLALYLGITSRYPRLTSLLLILQ